MDIVNSRSNNIPLRVGGKNMWERINLPKFICERFIGITIPIDNIIHIISYQGVHTINLSKPDIVVSDESFPEGKGLYDFETNILSYNNNRFRVIGLNGGKPIFENSKGEQLIIDTKNEVIKINNIHGDLEFCYRYDDFSGDWIAATFSENGDFLLLLSPYDIYAFRR